MKNVTVKDLMTPKPLLISPEATLIEAAEKMSSADVGFLPVGREDFLVGVITDRDIVTRGLAAGRDPKRSRVKDCLTPHVYACNEKDLIEDAADKMHAHKVTRLVVRNGHGDLTGVLSFGGILRLDTTSAEMSAAVKHVLSPETA